MFSTFTKLDGRALFIRSVDLRRLEDTEQGTLMTFDDCGSSNTEAIQGTAADNLARLAKEELEAYTQAQAQQQRVTNGLPVPPIQRGRR